MMPALVAGMSAFATQFTSGGLIYEVDDYNEATVIGCADSDALSVTIPYTFNYESGGEQYMFFVTKVAENAFAGTSITTLVLAEKDYSGASSKGDLVIESGAFNTPTLTDIIIDRKDLPVINGDPFSKETYENGSITFGDNLTEAEKEAYLAVSPWDKIGAGVMTSVTDVIAGNECIEFYSPDGMRVENPSSGIYIVRRGNTTSKQYLR